MRRGPAIILLFVGLGIAGGLFSVWWNASLYRRSSEYWGGDGARLIRLGKQVELWELAAGPDADGEKATRTWGGQSYHAARRHDLSSAPGLIHLREALLADGEYDWTAMQPSESDNAEAGSPPEQRNGSAGASPSQAGASTSQPQYLLIFSDGSQQLEIWLVPEQRWLGRVRDGNEARLTLGSNAAGIKKYLEKVLPAIAN